MNRRSFLATMLAAGMAPAIVRASSLMPIIARVQPIRKGGSVRWVPINERLADIAADRLRYEQMWAEVERAVNPPVIALPNGRVAIVRTGLPSQLWRMLDAAKTR